MKKIFNFYEKKIDEYKKNRQLIFENNNLIQSCTMGYLPGVMRSIGSGADVNCNDSRPLIIACSYRHKHIYEYLIKNHKNINPNIKNDLLIKTLIEIEDYNILRYIFDNQNSNLKLNMENLDKIFEFACAKKLFIVDFLCKNFKIKEETYKNGFKIAFKLHKKDILHYFIQNEEINFMEVAQQTMLENLEYEKDLMLDIKNLHDKKFLNIKLSSINFETDFNNKVVDKTKI